MKKGFYPKLALDAIRKNKRMYFPYILSYGCAVIAFFSLLFLFYTNSFLIKQRYREFGLYNVLGMDKRNISRLMLWESIYTAGMSIGAGVVCGMAFSKAIELVLLNILKCNWLFATLGAGLLGYAYYLCFPLPQVYTLARRILLTTAIREVLISHTPLIHLTVFLTKAWMFREKSLQSMHQVAPILPIHGMPLPHSWNTMVLESREEERFAFYKVNGSLFFIGIMLSVVFLMAAVLISYYKQISEGYEDQSRFEIMQKVGMTKKDIRKSINSQMLRLLLRYVVIPQDTSYIKIRRM